MVTWSSFYKFEGYTNIAITTIALLIQYPPRIQNFNLIVQVTAINAA